VTKTLQIKILIPISLTAPYRKPKIVDTKLIDLKIEEIPARCKEKIKISIAALSALDRGG